MKGNMRKPIHEHVWNACVVKIHLIIVKES